MTSNCKYCYLCSFYNAYYVKGYYSFNKISHGDCRKKRCTVNNYDSCENFKPKNRQSAEAKQLDLRKLEKLSDNFNELIQILKENFES